MDVLLTSYQAALEYLYARVSGGWKLGLATTEALLGAMGDPQARFASFHVGGTNGKGSVVSTLDVLLRAAGLRVGRYMSPHLIDFRERICVDGVPISEGEVVAFIERWTADVERRGATFFEATTCLAFDHFARAGVDVAVVEVGLGGRLDATNVLTPLVSGVTSIGLDHMQYLGDTLEQIACEKAGIFKAGVPAAVGESDPAVRRRLTHLARAAGASCVIAIGDEWRVADVAVDADGTSFTLETGGAGAEEPGRRRLRTPLVGRHQAVNTATALAMLRLAGPRYRDAWARAPDSLSRVRVPGRFQYWENVIFDVAHNPAGALVLVDTLRAVRPPRPMRCLLTVLRDKDWRGILDTLAPHVDHLVLSAPPSVPGDRAWALEDAERYAHEHGWSAEAVADFDQALRVARDGAATTLVTGSFHTVGDAMARLQVSPDAG